MFVIAKVRLVKDTRTIQTKTGTRMQSGFGFADIDGESGLPVGLVAFGNLAGELAKYGSGSNIRVSGTLKANDYTKSDGTEVSGYQIVADGIAGVKSARGKYGTPKQPAANQASSDFQDSPIPDSF